jgi:hypothetical protein
MKLKPTLPLVLLMLLGGCGDSKKPGDSGGAPPSVGAPVVPDQGRAKVEVGKDVPLYPGAARVSEGPMPEGHQVVLNTTDTLEKALAFYREQLPANDWKLVTVLEGNPGVIQATKGDVLLVINFFWSDTPAERHTEIGIEIGQPGSSKNAAR